jgi:hypothetical protein
MRILVPSALSTLAISLLALASLGAVAGCGSSTTVQPAAAWVVNFDEGTNGASCITNANFTDNFGQVSQSVIGASLNNGQTDTEDPTNPTATVTCSVSGTTTFSVHGEASTLSQELTISIASITSSATEANPATGSVSYESAAHTADTAFASESCNFYFKSGTGEAVASGKIWGAFSCPTIMGGNPQSTCGITESFFVFETCGM